MAKAKNALTQTVEQAIPETPEKTPEVRTGTLVKELAKELKTTGKKLRRYLRSQKYQRASKKWFLNPKQVQEVKSHFTTTKE